ncbi:stage V sporulation protein AE [Paraliobacillus sp. JSM ZJ581]|uniref:stage V sporulation protein AE n=1 Tax=Paraliobacillus sp. JSM ZJ581 TaxID=3342118 RepID=UPI0035A9899D
MKRKEIIIITDGDHYAREAIKYVSKQLGGTALITLADNPSKITPSEMIHAIKQASTKLVYVLIDDAGFSGVGAGEIILQALANDQSIVIIGAVAVAAHTKNKEWTRINFSIDRDGNVINDGVNKAGIPTYERGRINGDTVYLLDQLAIPTIVGVGDIGKMDGHDDVSKGCPITTKAIELILERRQQGHDEKNSNNC